MILKIARRSLAARPVRSAVLAVGFGLGVAVMAALLGVGAVILDQARAPALVGGGDVRIGSSAGRVPNARFVLYALRPGGPFGSAVAAAAPSRREALYLRHDGRAIPVAVRGGIPSDERAFADPETSGVAGWTDTSADRDWTSNDAGSVLRTIDRFHRIPDVPSRAQSWAEWLYFNGRSRDCRFYLTFLAGPEVRPGRRTLGVRLQLERGGRMSAYAARSEVDSGALVASAPDIEAGANRVRLAGTDYRITLDLAPEAGGPHVAGTFVVHADPDRSVPPFVLEGARGWLSGYTVPVTAGSLDGTLRIGADVLDLSGGTAYHDHNWGFWEGVSWQWGQVQHDELSIVYGRIRPPADAADPEHVPGFLAVLGPSGPVAFSSNTTIEETNAPGSDRPQRIRVTTDAAGFSAAIDIAVDQTTATRMRPGGVGDGRDFLQLRAEYTVHVQIGDRRIDFTAPGSAETFRGSNGAR